MAVRTPGKLLVVALLVAVTLAAYAPLFGNAFVNYDDDLYITNNHHVRGGLEAESVTWAFTTFQGANWFPLTRLSWMLDAELFGLNATGFHLTNLLLHVANAVLVFLVLARMTGAIGASAFVAAIFAVHPLHVESVAWAAARKDVLSGLFALLALLAYERYVRSPRPRGWYAALTAALALGLMAKPTLVTLPFLLLLLDEWPLVRLRRPEPPATWESSRVRRAIAEKLPLLVLVAAASAVTWVAQHSGGTVQSLEIYPLAVRAQNALVATIAYIAKAFWPSGLAVFYPHPGRALPIAQVVGAAAALTAISAGVVYALRRRPYLAVGWLWFIGGLVPVIGLVQVGQAAMADRYTYLPLIGLAVMLAWGAHESAQHSRALARGVAALGAVVVVVLAWVTADQVRTWRSSVTLLEHALRVTERNHVAHTNLGLALAGADQLDAAAAHLLAALRFAPGAPMASGLLAELRVRQARLEDARRHYQAALRRRPYLAVGWLWFVGGLVPVIGLVQVGQAAMADRYTYLPLIGLAVMVAWGARESAERSRALARGAAALGTVVVVALAWITAEQVRTWRSSVTLLEHALRVTERNHVAHTNLGLALAGADRLDAAAAHLLAALRFAPGAPMANGLLAELRVRQERLEDARRHYQAALRNQPEEVRWLVGLGSVLLQLEEFARAESRYRTALQIRASAASAHAGLGLALLGQERVDAAIASFEEARRLEPAEAQVHEQLGRALQRAGRDAEAIAAYREAHRLGARSSLLLNNLAWLLATSDRASPGDPAEAVAFAGKAVAATRRMNPAVLDTLAVAYAAAGRPQDALRTAREALAVAEEKGDDALASEIRERIESYTAGSR